MNGDVQVFDFLKFGADLGWFSGLLLSGSLIVCLLAIRASVEE